MTEQIKAVADVVEALLLNQAKKATKYLSDKFIVGASRKTFDGKIKKGNAEIIIVMGKPNYQQREFIKQCKKAGEPFPVKKIQLKFPPKKRT